LHQQSYLFATLLDCFLYYSKLLLSAADKASGCGVRMYQQLLMMGVSGSSWLQSVSDFHCRNVLAETSGCSFVSGNVCEQVFTLWGNIHLRIRVGQSLFFAGQHCSTCQLHHVYL